MRRLACAELAVFWLALAPLLVPVVVSIWLPVWQHCRVPGLTLDRAALDSLRAMPADARLLALEGQAQRLRTIFTADQALRQAAAIGEGYIELPNG